MSRNAGSGVDDPCECGVRDPERESNKQPESPPAARCSRSERTVFRTARGGRLQSESRFGGGGGLGGTVRRRGMGWGRRGAGAHHLEARGRLQRVDRRGRLSGVILSIWRIESEQAKRRVGAQSRRRRAHYVGGLQGAWSDPPPPLPLPRTPLVGAPVPRVAARDGPARLQHFPCDVPCPGPPGL